MDWIYLSVKIQPLQVKDCCIDYHHARIKAMLLTFSGLSMLASRSRRRTLSDPPKTETGAIWRAFHTTSYADQLVISILRHIVCSLSSCTAIYSSSWLPRVMVDRSSPSSFSKPLAVYTFQHRLHGQFRRPRVQLPWETSIFDTMLSTLILGLTTSWRRSPRHHYQCLKP